MQLWIHSWEIYPRSLIESLFFESSLTEHKKEPNIVFYPDSYIFVFSKIAQVYLLPALWRMHKGHFLNEWVFKTFWKLPRSSNLVCLKSSLQFTHKLYPSRGNSKIPRNSFYIFLWNFAEDKHPEMWIRAEIWLRDKTIVTSLSRDIHLYLEKVNILIWFNLCVIHVLRSIYYKDQAV